MTYFKPGRYSFSFFFYYLERGKLAGEISTRCFTCWILQAAQCRPALETCRHRLWLATLHTVARKNLRCCSGWGGEKKKKNGTVLFWGIRLPLPPSLKTESSNWVLWGPRVAMSPVLWLLNWLCYSHAPHAACCRWWWKASEESVCLLFFFQGERGHWLQFCIFMPVRRCLSAFDGKALYRGNNWVLHHLVFPLSLRSLRLHLFFSFFFFFLGVHLSLQLPKKTVKSYLHTSRTAHSAHNSEHLTSLRELYFGFLCDLRPTCSLRMDADSLLSLLCPSSNFCVWNEINRDAKISKSHVNMWPREAFVDTITENKTKK